MKCTTVQILIKDPQFKSISRQKKLEKPTYVSKRYTQCHDGACKILEFKIADTNDVCNGTNLVGENDVYEQMSLIEDNTEYQKK